MGASKGLGSLAIKTTNSRALIVRTPKKIGNCHVGMLCRPVGVDANLNLDRGQHKDHEALLQGLKV